MYTIGTQKSKPEIGDLVMWHGKPHMVEAWLRRLTPDEPCDHPGCLSHVTHPCEGCGRIAGRAVEQAPEAEEEG